MVKYTISTTGCSICERLLVRMAEEKRAKARSTVSRPPGPGHNMLVSRLLRITLLAAGVTILFTAAEIGVLLLFKFPLAGGSTIQHFSDVPGDVARDAFLLLIPGVEFAAIFLIASVSIRPMALLAYLRSIGEAREYLYRRSIPAIQPAQNSHQLVLGAAGAGKSSCVCAYEALQPLPQRAYARKHNQYCWQ